MSESISSHASSGKSHIALESLNRGIGYGLFLAVFLAIAWGPELMMGFELNAVSAGITRCILFAGVVGSYLFASANTSFLNTRSHAIAASIIGCILLAQTPLASLAFDNEILSVGAEIGWISWLLAGIGAGVVNCVWVYVLAEFDDEKNTSTATAMVTTAIVFLAFCCMASPAINIAIAIALVASVAIGQFSQPYPDIPESYTPQMAHEARASIHFDGSGSFVMAINGIGLGMVSALVLFRVASGVFAQPFMSVPAIGAPLLLMLIRKTEPGLLNVFTSQMFFLPFIILSLLLVHFIPGPYNVVPALAAMTLFFLFDRANLEGLIIRSSFYQYAAVTYFAQGRIFIMAGLMCGWACGAFLASEVGHGLFGIVATVLISLICLHFSIMAIRTDKGKPGSNTPERLPEVDNEINQTSLDDTADALERADASENEGSSVDASIHETQASVEAAANAPSPFKQKCTYIGKTYGLTPREIEILFFLAKGRNVKFIASKLFISERTAKTHAYHLYQKLNIHSQQELMDIVDSIQDTAANGQ